VANPLLIGELPHDGTHFVIGRHWMEHFTRYRAADGGDITVEKLRHWINDPKKTGLTREAENLIILLYAAQSGMSFTIQGGPTEGTIARLDNACVLVQEAPPDATEWRQAVPRAGSVFGIAISPLCTATNAATLAARVKEIAASSAAGARQYAGLLRRRLTGLGIAEADATRLQTAAATQALLDSLVQSDDRGVVGVLARAAVPTSEAAMGECVKNGPSWGRSLEGEFFALADRVAGMAEDVQARAKPILDDVRQSLRHDAHVNPTPLGDVLATASRRLLDVLLPPDPPPPPPPPPGRKELRIPNSGSESIAADRASERIAQIQQAHPSAEIEVSIRWKSRGT
jgi:hypothetical protein